jgi:polyferredoxin
MLLRLRERLTGSVLPIALLGTYCIVPALGILWRSSSPRIIWLFISSILPLFLGFGGFHYWRNVCPLYFFARIPALLGIQRKRRVSLRYEKFYYYIAFAFFLGALWLRLVIMDSDGYQIALFFILVSGVAFATGVLFTGRTWCNYLCPVSIVEKLYAEASASIPKRSSQCDTCTACKSACPDINLATGHWKEIGLPSKRFAYFAFPGVALAFYLYFYYQSGLLTDFVSSPWAKEAGFVQSALAAAVIGITTVCGFIQNMPATVAPAFVLCAGAAMSFAFFFAIEWATSRALHGQIDPLIAPRIRHHVFGTAAIAAFLISGTLAGEGALSSLAPTVRIAAALPVCLAVLAVARRRSWPFSFRNEPEMNSTLQRKSPYAKADTSRIDGLPFHRLSIQGVAQPPTRSHYKCAEPFDPISPAKL